MYSFNLLKANLRKEYIQMIRYLPNTIAMLLTFYIIFLAMFAGIQVVGNPDTQDINIQYVIVNYIFWYLTMAVVNNVGWEITNEAGQGTFEQLSMSPMGVWKIMLTRLFSSTLVNFIIIIALLYLSMATTGQWLNLDAITLLPILLITLFSMFGLGFMIAGLTVILKQVQAFLQILQFILAALTFVPLSVTPILALLPIVQGVDLIRKVMINGYTISDISWMNFLMLGINAILYFTIGLAIFIYCEKFARKKGLLAHY